MRTNNKNSARRIPSTNYIEVVRKQHTIQLIARHNCTSGKVKKANSSTFGYITLTYLQLHGSHTKIILFVQIHPQFPTTNGSLPGGFIMIQITRFTCYGKVRENTKTPARTASNKTIMTQTTAFYTAIASTGNMHILQKARKTKRATEYQSPQNFRNLRQST